MARDIFQFSRGVFCAWLNARTIGITFPTLILNGSLHSTTQLQDMVDKLYSGESYFSNGTMNSDMGLVYADWDNSEEVTCSMLGSC